MPRLSPTEDSHQRGSPHPIPDTCDEADVGSDRQPSCCVQQGREVRPPTAAVRGPRRAGMHCAGRGAASATHTHTHTRTHTRTRASGANASPQVPVLIQAAAGPAVAAARRSRATISCRTRNRPRPSRPCPLARASQSLGRGFHPLHDGADRSHVRLRFHFSDMDAARPNGRQHSRFQPGHRPHHLHCDRPVGHYRQPRLHRRHRRRGVEFEQCGHVHGLERRLQPADGCGHRIRQHSGRLHQHWRSHRAAGRDGSHSGRHRRPQRCPRLLLRGRHPALHRRRNHLEPDHAKRGRGIRDLDGLLLCRRGFCRICVEHHQSSGRGSRSHRLLRRRRSRCEPAPVELRRPLLLDRRRGRLASGHHYRRQRRSGAVGCHAAARAQRQRRHGRGLEPRAQVVRGCRPLPRLLHLSRRCDLDAPCRCGSAGRRNQLQAVPHQPRNPRRPGLPHLSRRAGRQSHQRRHLRLDRRHRQ